MDQAERERLWNKHQENPPPLKDAVNLIEEDILTGTDFYPDDTDIPMDEVPQIWKDEVLDFGCWEGHHFKSKMEGLFVDCDYFIPEAKCPTCGEQCFIKKWK